MSGTSSMQLHGVQNTALHAITVPLVPSSSAKPGVQYDSVHAFVLESILQHTCAHLKSVLELSVTYTKLHKFYL